MKKGKIQLILLQTYSLQLSPWHRHEDQKGSQSFGSQAKRNGSTQIISSKIHDFTVKEAILRQTWVQKQVMYNNKQIYFDNDYFPDLQRRAQVRDMIRQLKKKDSTAQSFYPAQLKISLNTFDKTFSTLADALPTLQELGVKTQMGKCDALEMELSKALWQTWRGGHRQINQATLSDTDVRAFFPE